MPRISVIVPIYNIENYLTESLDSLKAQSVSDAEFICINDGSRDSSLQILRQYAAEDSRFKIIDKENGGVSSARNAGLKEASGKWIMFLDGDDRFKPDALEKVLKIATEENDNLEIIVFQADTFPANIEEEPWWKKTLQFPEASYEKFEPRALFSERGAMPFMWRHAYKKELLDRAETSFEERLTLGEDSLFDLMVFPEAKGIEFVSDILYDYRLGRTGSAMEKERSDKDAEVGRHYDVIKAAAENWKIKGWLDLYGADLLAWALKYTILRVKALEQPQRKKRANEMFEDIICPYGLEKHKGKMNLQGKLLWFGFKHLRK